MTKAMMQLLINMTEFLGKVLGPDYEIVFHDLKDKDRPVVAICNGQISGRTLDAPLSDKALQMIADETYKDSDYVINYAGLSQEDQKMLRSSTLFIKDDTGELAGMLCINFDDSRYQHVSDQILKLRHPDAFVDTNFVYNPEKARREVKQNGDAETFYNSIGDVADGAITKVLEDMAIPVERLTQEEKQTIVGILEEKGVFLLRGSVRHVAKALRCSQATIYRYMNKVNQDKGSPS